MKYFFVMANRLMLAVLLLCGALSQESAAKEVTVSEAELEQMLAPIALYPDTVLSHILIASTYPVDVVQAARWSKANRDLTASTAVAAVDNKDWDPSVKALVAFPQIMERMSEDLEWTERLGQAFLQDEAEVMARVQALRERAYASGSLESLEHLRVQRDAETIVIEPAQKQIIYIPYYDTNVVYGRWHWQDHPPTYWEHPAYVIHRPGSWFYWSSGVYVPPRIFFSSFHWHRGHVIVVDLYPYPVHFYSHGDILHHRDAQRWRHRPRHSGYWEYQPESRHDYHRREDRERRELEWREHSYRTHPGGARQRVITAPEPPHSGRTIRSGRDDELERRRIPEQDTRPPAGVIQQHPAHRTERAPEPPSKERAPGHLQSPHKLIREHQKP